MPTTRRSTRIKAQQKDNPNPTSESPQVSPTKKRKSESETSPTTAAKKRPSNQIAEVNPDEGGQSLDSPKATSSKSEKLSAGKRRASKKAKQTNDVANPEIGSSDKGPTVPDDVESSKSVAATTIKDVEETAGQATATDKIVVDPDEIHCFLCPKDDFSDKTQYPIGSPLHDPCNEILLCDSPNCKAVAFHQRCHFIPLFVIPRGTWVCLLCRFEEELSKKNKISPQTPSRKRRSRKSRKLSQSPNAFLSPAVNDRPFDKDAFLREFDHKGKDLKAEYTFEVLEHLTKSIDQTLQRIRASENTIRAYTETERSRKALVAAFPRVPSELTQAKVRHSESKVRIRHQLLSLKRYIEELPPRFEPRFDSPEHHADNLDATTSTKEKPGNDNKNSEEKDSEKIKTATVQATEPTKKDAGDHVGSSGGQSSMIDSSDIICCVCHDGHSTDDNDVIMCDGKRCFRAFHMSCLRPKLSWDSLKALRPGSETWFCPFCTKLATFMHHVQEEYYGDEGYYSDWAEAEDVFPEAEEEYKTSLLLKEGKAPLAALGDGFGEEDFSPKLGDMAEAEEDEDEEDDEDFDPDHEDNVEKEAEQGSDSGSDVDSSCSESASDDPEDTSLRDELAALSSAGEESEDTSGEDSSRRRKTRQKAAAASGEAGQAGEPERRNDRVRQPPEDMGSLDQNNVMEGKRRRAKVDYRKLNDAMFGSAAAALIAGIPDDDDDSYHADSDDSEEETGSQKIASQGRGNNTASSDDSFSSRDINHKKKRQRRSAGQRAGNRRIRSDSFSDEKETPSEKKLRGKERVKGPQCEDNSENKGSSKLFCKCKRSKCLKLYCQCFSNSRPCSDRCKCKECANNDEHSSREKEEKVPVVAGVSCSYKQPADKPLTEKSSEDTSPTGKPLADATLAAKSLTEKSPADRPSADESLATEASNGSCAEKLMGDAKASSDEDLTAIAKGDITEKSSTGNGEEVKTERMTNDSRSERTKSEKDGFVHEKKGSETECSESKNGDKKGNTTANGSGETMSRDQQRNNRQINEMQRKNKQNMHVPNGELPTSVAQPASNFNASFRVENSQKQEASLVRSDDSDGVSKALQVAGREGQSQGGESSKREQGTSCCCQGSCLSLDCPCFSSSKVCSVFCSCKQCYNKSSAGECTASVKRKPIRHILLSPISPKKVSAPSDRRKSKKRYGSISGTSSSEVPTVCMCKKSKCLKLYCVCYSSSRRCSGGCQCVECGNRDGSNNSAPVTTPTEQNKMPSKPEGSKALSSTQQNRKEHIEDVLEAKRHDTGDKLDSSEVRSEMLQGKAREDVEGSKLENGYGRKHKDELSHKSPQKDEQSHRSREKEESSRESQEEEKLREGPQKKVEQKKAEQEGKNREQAQDEHRDGQELDEKIHHQRVEQSIGNEEKQQMEKKDTENEKVKSVIKKHAENKETEEDKMSKPQVFSRKGEKDKPIEDHKQKQTVPKNNEKDNKGKEANSEKKLKQTKTEQELGDKRKPTKQSVTRDNVDKKGTSKTRIGMKLEGRQKSSHAASSTGTNNLAVQKPLGSEVAGVCSCKKSRCLKLYCICYASSRRCTATCQCLNCCNAEIGSGQAKPMNPPKSSAASAAGAEKNLQDSNQDQLAGAKPVSKASTILKSWESQVAGRTFFDNDRGKNVCMCKKSKCLKLYCVCYASSRRCTTDCRCVSCANGREENAIIHDASRPPKPLPSESKPVGWQLNSVKAEPIHQHESKGNFSHMSHNRPIESFGERSILIGPSADVHGQAQRASKDGADDGPSFCSCKKSKCLKLYCVCFSSHRPCSESCKCNECSNSRSYHASAPVHQQPISQEHLTQQLVSQQLANQHGSHLPVLLPKPLPQGAGNSIYAYHKECTPIGQGSFHFRRPPGLGDSMVLASARENFAPHNSTGCGKTVCMCKKSKCLKLYCACYASGHACSGECLCIDCANGELGKTGLTGGKQPILLPKPLPATVGTVLPNNNSNFYAVRPMPYGHHASAAGEAAVYMSQEESDKIRVENSPNVCSCKKSKCLKLYCVCYANLRRCADSCQCQDCMNKICPDHCRCEICTKPTGEKRFHKLVQTQQSKLNAESRKTEKSDEKGGTVGAKPSYGRNNNGERDGGHALSSFDDPGSVRRLPKFSFSGGDRSFSAFEPVKKGFSISRAVKPERVHSANAEKTSIVVSEESKHSISHSVVGITCDKKLKTKSSRDARQVPSTSTEATPNFGDSHISKRSASSSEVENLTCDEQLNSKSPDTVPPEPAVQPSGANGNVGVPNNADPSSSWNEMDSITCHEQLMSKPSRTLGPEPSVSAEPGRTHADISNDFKRSQADSEVDKLTCDERLKSRSPTALPSGGSSAPIAEKATVDCPVEFTNSSSCSQANNITVLEEAKSESSRAVASDPFIAPMSDLDSKTEVSDGSN